jgi:DNA-binding NarL/FixJ family response regulator
MCKLAVESLKTAGFERTRCALDIATAKSAMMDQVPDLLLVDIHLGNEELDGLDFLKLARLEGYSGIAVIITSDMSAQQASRSASAGANDFLLKGKYLNFPGEVTRILKLYNRAPGQSSYAPDVVSKLGYFRSYGLTNTELQLVTAFCKDYGFPVLKELADDMNMPVGSLRKHFSNIYRKFRVKNLHQLIHRITVCMILAEMR